MDNTNAEKPRGCEPGGFQSRERGYEGLTICLRRGQTDLSCQTVSERTARILRVTAICAKFQQLPKMCTQAFTPISERNWWSFSEPIIIGSAVLNTRPFTAGAARILASQRGLLTSRGKLFLIVLVRVEL